MKINIQFIWNTLNYSTEVYLAATLGKYNSQSSLNKAAHRNLSEIVTSVLWREEGFCCVIGLEEV